MSADPTRVRAFLMDLQDQICAGLEAADGQRAFRRDVLEGERGGLARPRVLEDGAHIERAAANLSHAVGAQLPAPATARHPHLAGQPFQAISLSVIVHPRNPHAPTTHANFRLFAIGPAEAPTTWWFGGGFDLTPIYGYAEDARAWHRAAHDACARHDGARYPRFKAACDDYFFLPWRNEARGVGGLFFDDLNEWAFDREAAFVEDVARTFLPTYLQILERRKHTLFGDRERAFQALRRGRYAEFNLVQDRGTKYGLASGNRIESVLASLPPMVAWRYDVQHEPGTPEAELAAFLQPRDWLAAEG